MKRNSRNLRNSVTVAGAGLTVVLLTALSASASPAGARVAQAPRVVAAGQAGSAAVTITQGQRAQPIDGFGFTEAFREPIITALPQAEQLQLGSLLFDPTAGAGFSIVRFGLGGSTDPGDVISGPGDVADQVWLGKLAEEFG